MHSPRKSKTMSHLRDRNPPPLPLHKGGGLFRCISRAPCRAALRGWSNQTLFITGDVCWRRGVIGTPSVAVGGLEGVRWGDIVTTSFQRT